MRFPLLDRAPGRVHRHAARRLQGARAREALPLQARLPLAAPRRDPRQAQARLRGADERLAAQRIPGFRDLARDTLLSPRARRRAATSGREPSSASSPCTRRTRPRTTAISSGRVLMLELWHRRHVEGRRGMSGAAALGASAAGRAPALHHAGLLAPLTRGGRLRASRARVPDPHLPPRQRRRRPVLPRAAHRGVRAPDGATWPGTTACCPLEELVERMARGRAAAQRRRHHLRRRLPGQPHARRAHPGPASGLPATIFLATGFIGTRGGAVVRPARAGAQAEPRRPTCARPGARSSAARRRRPSGCAPSSGRSSRLQARARRGAARELETLLERARRVDRPAGVQEPHAVVGRRARARRAWASRSAPTPSAIRSSPACPPQRAWPRSGLARP